MNSNELKNMSVNDRLQAMETLWGTFVYDNTPIDSPEWHGEILAQRKEKIEQGQAKFISLDALKRYYSDKN